MSALDRAEQAVLDHSADEDGWCVAHLREFGLHIPAGTCSRFVLAAQFIRGRRSDQARRRPVSVKYERRT